MPYFGKEGQSFISVVIELILPSLSLPFLGCIAQAGTLTSGFKEMMPAVLSSLDVLLHQYPAFKNGAGGYAASRAITRMKKSEPLGMPLYVYGVADVDINHGDALDLSSFCVDSAE